MSSHRRYHMLGSVLMTLRVFSGNAWFAATLWPTLAVTAICVVTCCLLFEHWTCSGRKFTKVQSLYYIPSQPALSLLLLIYHPPGFTFPSLFLKNWSPSYLWHLPVSLKIVNDATMLHAPVHKAYLWVRDRGPMPRINWVWFQFSIMTEFDKFLASKLLWWFCTWACRMSIYGWVQGLV